MVVLQATSRSPLVTRTRGKSSSVVGRPPRQYQPNRGITRILTDFRPFRAGVSRRRTGRRGRPRRVRGALVRGSPALSRKTGARDRSRAPRASRGLPESRPALGGTRSGNLRNGMKIRERIKTAMRCSRNGGAMSGTPSSIDVRARPCTPRSSRRRSGWHRATASRSPPSRIAGRSRDPGPTRVWTDAMAHRRWGRCWRRERGATLSSTARRGASVLRRSAPQTPRRPLFPRRALLLASAASTARRSARRSTPPDSAPRRSCSPTHPLCGIGH